MLVLLAGLVILFFPTSSSFANTFLEDKTMELYRGEIGEYCVYLQNTGEEDSLQMINVINGGGHIENLDEVSKIFEVPTGTVSDDLPVCMNVKLPRDSEKGEKYMISYGVANIESNEEKGLVSFAPVQVRESFYITERLDKRSVPLITYIVLVIVVIAASGIIVGYRRRRNTIRELEN